MGRTAGKRKSEGDLPAKKKSRKTSPPEEESGSGRSGNESIDQLYVDDEPSKARHVKKPLAKPRKSEPVRRAERSDEYEEDEGRMESQKFLAMVELQQKKKIHEAKSTSEYMEKFTKAVKNDEQVLKQHIGTLSDESNKRDADFIEAFTDAFATTRPKAPPGKDYPRSKNSSSGMVFASLYEQSRQLTANAFAIVDKFEKANEQTTRIDASDLVDKDSWADEIDNMENLLDVGHAAGNEKYQKLLSTSKTADVDEEVNPLAEAFYPPSEAPTSIGWGQIAKKAEKATRKLVKALPLQMGP